MRYETINPADGRPLQSWQTMSATEIEFIIAGSRTAFGTWRELSVADRAPLVLRLASVLRENNEEYARLASLEMGKPITEARAEVEKCAWLCEVYAERAEDWLREEEAEADGLYHRVVYRPLGVIFSIMPWNYPYWQALRFGVPALLAGNTSILKHASNVTGCGLAIEEMFVRAGFPADVFRTVLADHDGVANLIADERVRGVSLTGSTGAGQRIAETAGRHLKKVVLELGGSDPFIVLDDADVEIAARNAVLGRLLCTGQSCIAAKRFIVDKTVAEAFTERFAELMAARAVGNPLDEKTEVGAIVNEAELAALEGIVADARDKGATVLCGGARLDRPGCFFAPTVITDTTPAMRVVREEVFGPIAPVIVVDGDDEALRVANDTEFGLGGSVWTRDTDRGETLARRLDCGTAFVNSITKSDPRLPFGGVKQSGLGRELGRFGLREFVNVMGVNVYEHV